MTNDELAAIAARAWGIVRASTTPEIGVVAVHALQARIEGALREQATAAAERERVLREACEKALAFHNRYCDRVGAADGWARAVHEALRAALEATK